MLNYLTGSDRTLLTDFYRRKKKFTPQSTSHTYQKSIFRKKSFLVDWQIPELAPDSNRTLNPDDKNGVDESNSSNTSFY